MACFRQQENSTFRPSTMLAAGAIDQPVVGEPGPALMADVLRDRPGSYGGSNGVSSPPPSPGRLLSTLRIERSMLCVRRERRPRLRPYK